MSCCELFQAFFRTTNQTVIPSAYEPPENRRQTAEYTIPNHDPRGVYSFNFFSQPVHFQSHNRPSHFIFPSNLIVKLLNGRSIRLRPPAGRSARDGAWKRSMVKDQASVLSAAPPTIPHPDANNAT